MSRHLRCSICGWLTFRSLDKRLSIAYSKQDPGICGRCIRHRFEEHGLELMEEWDRQRRIAALAYKPPLDLDISQAGLICLAAQMTAAADLQLAPRSRPLGQRNRWTLLLHEAIEIQHRDIDIPFIERLERNINRELAYYGRQPVSFAQILQEHENQVSLSPL